MKNKSKKNKYSKAPEPPSEKGKEENAGNISEYQLEKMLLIAPQVKWFEQAGTKGTVKTHEMGEITYLYNKELATYRRGEHFREWGWATRKGTSADRISAYTLLLINSVAHNLDGLDQMVAMAGPQHLQVSLVLKSLQQLLISVVLPSNRKLVPLCQRPLSSQPVSQATALLWYVEDRIRNSYVQFLSHLEKMTMGSVKEMKEHATRLLADLLAHSPEQEQFILTKLTNKLGDPIREIGSKAAFHMTRVLKCHPNMKLVMVKEVERLLFRSNVSERAQYSTMCFLNQIVFQPGDTELATRMLNTYLRFFNMLSQKKKGGSINSRMLKAILSGASRAFPYTEGSSSVAQEHIETLFKQVHQVEFGAGVQALNLLFRILDRDGLVSDRFYASLYHKLLDPNMDYSPHLRVFLNLLYCALKKDNMTSRLHAFVKRIFHVAPFQPYHNMAGLLFLISRLQVHHPYLLADSTPNMEEEDDGPEYYPDVKDSEDEEESPKKQPPQGGWDHRANVGGSYKPMARDPRFANAENRKKMEQLCLARTSHPAVNKFQEQLQKPIQYSGDPLSDFTVSHFFEKAIGRNPKKTAPQGSVFKARMSCEAYSNIVDNDMKEVNKLPSHKKETRDEEEILDELFEEHLDTFDLPDLPGKKKKKKGKKDSEDDSDDDPEFDEDDEEELREAFKDDDIFGTDDEEDLEEELDAQLDEEKPPPKKRKFSKMMEDDNDDEIYEMMEENEDVGVAANDYVNTDKSHPKQLKWERKREYSTFSSKKKQFKHPRKKFKGKH